MYSEEDLLPLSVSRHPRAVFLPTMQVRETLRPDVIDGEAPGNRGSKLTLVLIQYLVRKTRTCDGVDSTLSELQMITLPDTPCLKRRLREDDSQGVTDASNGHLHRLVITRYNISRDSATACS